MPELPTRDAPPSPAKTRKKPAWALVLAAGVAAAAFVLYALGNRAKLLHLDALILIGVAAVVCFVLIFWIYRLLFVRHAPLYRVFVPAALLLGLLYGLAFPVGSVPDEPMHAETVYVYVNRLMGKDAVPSESQFSNVYQVIDTVMRARDLEERSLVSTAAGLSTWRGVASGARFWYEAADKPDTSTALVSTEVSFVMYLPAMAGFLFARLTDLGFYPMLILGRACMLLFYVLMTAWAIKRLPYGKTALFVTALLPMSLHLASSLNYDAVVLPLGFALTATLLDLAFGGADRLRLSAFVPAAVLTALLAVCKVGSYLPLLLLVFLIPKARFARRGHRPLLFFALLGMGLVFVLLGNLSAVLAAFDGNLMGAEPSSPYTLTYLFTHFFEVVAMMARTVVKQAASYVAGCIGSNLSWFSVPISSTAFLAYFMLLISSCLLPASEPNAAPGFAGRLLFALPAVLTLVCFYVGMLLWWTPEGSAVITGVQGRYFLPVLPAALLFLPRVSLRGTLHLTKPHPLPLGVSPDCTIAFLVVITQAVTLAGLFASVMGA